MQLTEFLKGVAGLCADSRVITPTDTFVALKSGSDGHQFASAAYARGVRSFLLSQPLALPPDAQVFICPDLDSRLPEIAKVVYPHSQAPRLIGVTGTSGKTSFCHILAHAATMLGIPCAQLGTLGAQFGSETQSTGLTTPDLLSVYRHCDRFANQGAQWIAMEASSHALVQGRLEGMPFDTAVFTNLSRDHLDYHGDMAQYGAAKTKLFQVPGLKYAVLHQDDPFTPTVRAAIAPSTQVLSYSVGQPGADIVATAVQGYRDCTEADIETPWGHEKLLIPFVGAFSLANVLAVIGVCGLHGVPLASLMPVLTKIPLIPGRMTRFHFPGRPTVFVDYAHKPGALEAVFQALAGIARYSKIWCVFGCGGDRDPGKRALMGAVADRWADHIILTDDNPRSENSAHIIQQISEGIRYPQKVVVCHERSAAIRLAIEAAEPQDIVLVAGKGHENYQIFHDRTVEFSDLAFVAEVLRG